MDKCVFQKKQIMKDINFLCLFKNGDINKLASQLKNMHFKRIKQKVQEFEKA